MVKSLATAIEYFFESVQSKLYSLDPKSKERNPAKVSIMNEKLYQVNTGFIRNFSDIFP